MVPPHRPPPIQPPGFLPLRAWLRRRPATVVRSTGLTAAVWLLAAALASAAAEWTQPLLWKVERPGHAVSYLFGTIHLPDPGLGTFPAPVEKARRAAGAVYTEIPMDIASLLAQSGRLLLDGDKTLDDVLPEPLVARVETALRRIDPALDLRPFYRHRIWALFATLSILEAQMKYPALIPMDLRIYQEAVVGGQRVGGIETVEEQVAVFQAFSEAEQVRMLELQLDYMDAAREQNRPWTDAMLAAYRAGDLDGLAGFADDYLGVAGPQAPTAADRALHDRFMAVLVTRRNQTMAERIDRLLAASPETAHFIAVGALHFAGPEGIPERLRARGWRVTAIGAAGR